MNKNFWHRNGEGYSDKTAGVAMQRVARAERKDIMAKRSCRKTVDEKRIHEKAVKMRKMTDEQLVNYVENRVEKARSEGFNKGKAQAVVKQIDINKIMDEIGCIKGVGKIKQHEIRMVLEKNMEGC